MVSLKRRPLIHTELKTLATSKKTVPVSSFLSKFPLTLSTSRAKLLVHQKTVIIDFSHEHGMQNFSKNFPTVK